MTCFLSVVLSLTHLQAQTLGFILVNAFLPVSHLPSDTSVVCIKRFDGCLVHVMI
uniref:Uncharacterized protein n=1 Tax=Anguilla anguilla TaxID=7936 RepID=A0A0E9Q2I5_ANGAN